MNDRDILTRGIHTDCLLNYETVKYFNGERHEGERYRAAIADYQALEYRVIGGSHLGSRYLALTSPQFLSTYLIWCRT